ncbi:hypothetical protein MSG28_014531 [Choristoneura fumiferana]|uniref:Uncharacterized protein n=1 Tax=Choristoneura fumiferana TaxID=7141 RepID=A0ACC0JSD7_CHOFU|nr:hypothetical protein MSG28_014531 [Choristoneura fumiferana]
MPTAWIFVVLLYTTQAFHHVNPTPATEYRVIKQLEQPSTQQPPQTTANQRDDEFKRTMRTRPPGCATGYCCGDTAPMRTSSLLCRRSVSGS